MEKNKEPDTRSWIPVTDVPKGVGYSVVQDSSAGQLLAPDNAAVNVYAENVPGVKRIRMDVELVERQYNITNVEVSAPEGESLDLHLFRSGDWNFWLHAGVASEVRLLTPDGETFSAKRPLPAPDTNMEVALTYTVAYLLRQNPTKAVADRYELNAQAAAQRVKRARAKGYLPPTTVGKSS